MPKYSVVINTINRSNDIVLRSLRAVLDQALDFELILVDQNPKCLVLPPDIVSDARFIHHRVSHRSVSAARNSAPVSKEAIWIIFCDDDGFWAENYFKAFLEITNSNPKIDVIAGSIRRIDNGEFYSKRHAMGGDLGKFINLKLLMGSNFAVKRKLFISLKGFDERFGAGAIYGSSEETDFAWNGYFASAGMYFAPNLVVMHTPPFSGDTKTEVRKAFRYGLGKGRMVNKWLKQGKWIVLFELFEMMTVPFAKIISSLFLLRIKETAIHFYSLSGRLFGLFFDQTKD